MNQTAPTPEGKEEMPQATRLDDVRIRDVRPLISPALLQYELPADDATKTTREPSGEMRGSDGTVRPAISSGISGFDGSWLFEAAARAS